MINYEYKYIRKIDERNKYKQLENVVLRGNITYEIVDNGVILPQRDSNNIHHWMGDGGVIDSSGNFIKNSGILGFAENEGDYVFGGKYNCDINQTFSETVLYMGPFKPHWGHFLLEFITRLWYWIKYNPNIRVAYCGFACEQNSLSGNYLQLLNLLGIKKEQLIDVREPIRFSKIIIPEQSFLRDKYYSYEYKMIIDKLKQEAHCSGDLVGDVYFSRVEFIRNSEYEVKERGEESIVKQFRANRFDIVAPEKLSAVEQIRLMSSAKRIAVPIGGASMNLVFASSGCEVILLKKAYLMEMPNDMHMIANLVNASKVTFLDIYYKPYDFLPRTYGGGPHMLGVTREVKQYLDDNNMREIYDISMSIRKVHNFFWLTTKALKHILK